MNVTEREIKLLATFYECGYMDSLRHLAKLLSTLKPDTEYGFTKREINQVIGSLIDQSNDNYVNDVVQQVLAEMEDRPVVH